MDFIVLEFINLIKRCSNGQQYHGTVGNSTELVIRTVPKSAL